MTFNLKVIFYIYCMSNLVNFNDFIYESRKPRIEKIKIGGIFYHGSVVQDGILFDKPDVGYGDYDAVWFSSEEFISKEFSENWESSVDLPIIYKVEIKENKIANIPYDKFLELKEYYMLDDFRDIIEVLVELGFNGWKTTGSIDNDVYDDYALFRTDNMHVISAKIKIDGDWSDYMSLDSIRSILRK